MPPIRKVLIANRGEIAVRIIRTCHEMGLETVAVFSEPDRTALHVRMADEAIPLGGEKSADSYLVVEKLLDAARRTGADAIHPGYGFLSENAAFAEAVGKAGLIFIGPSPESIRMMGDKTSARQALTGTSVPLAPGTREAIPSLEEAVKIAASIGYPVLVKASAGGGGKGMRIIQSESELEKGFLASKNEARNAFGDDRVYIEKYLTSPRHIEFQILADSHGNIVHLFERDCSIQRRHQKVVEEAPSPVLTPDLRQRMGAAAVEVARRCNYTGAGTVEFLLDSNQQFYFLEMNTRLQVEHPVTEWITGLDLVREQIRIANREPLAFRQEDLTIRGHAIECRIYAEDPMNQFLPDTGRVHLHRIPSGPGIRVDSGIVDGMEVTVFYDPMISKLSVWDQTRDGAIRRMSRALEEYSVSGVQTTIPFCQFVMQHEVYQRGEATTHFIQTYFNPDSIEINEEGILKALAVAGLNACHWFARKEPPVLSNSQPLSSDGSVSLWKTRRRYP
ncbi:MAG: acetyl-CoA carboxylase biotin carboxylase subunit [Bacteroidetes bacterium]|nr:acetyl-CoA carboxylase biotin carboxylase subunit [Bacteroidota bacterium]